MRFGFIELVGYAGIYDGMGLNQIRIDYTKCIYGNIVIRGKNGSGKSTLLNAFTPLPDSNDSFLPSVEARKIISVISYDTEYVIRYIHPVNSSGERLTTRGYISKVVNGQLVELNPNGNISSCKDIIYEEFELDPAYISLSKLSSENRGLVDSKPADRKRLVVGILNSVETYNAIHKNISKKTSAYKQLINTLVYKIDKIGDENKLSNIVIGLENKLSQLEKDKEKAIEASALLKMQISEYEDILRENNYDNIVYDLKENNRTLDSIYSSIQKKLNDFNIDDISKVDPFVESIKDKISALENALFAKKQIIPELLALRDADFKNMNDKQIALNSLTSDYDYSEVKSALENARSVVNKYEGVFSSLGLSPKDLITRIEYETAMTGFNSLIQLSNNLLYSYSESDLRDAIYGNNIGEYNVSELENEEYHLKKEKEFLDVQISKFEAMMEVAKGLNKRPKNCKIDSCPYIASAVEANKNYPESQYNNLISRRDNIIKRLLEISDIFRRLNTLNNIKKDLRVIDIELKDKIKFMRKFNIREDFVESFYDRVLNHDPFNDIAELYRYNDYANILDEYNNAKEQLKTYEVEYKLYESKNSIIDSMIKDIENLNNKLSEADKKIDTTHAEIQEISKNIELTNYVKSKVCDLQDKINSQYKSLLDKKEELETLKESLESNNVALIDLREKLSSCDNIIGGINSDIKNTTNDRDNCKRALDALVEYKSELNMYNDKYIKLDKIKYYSTPSSGIQTVFIQMYMDKIVHTANEMLSMLFDGQFVLQKFIINETEFRIPCLGEGLLHDDISSMSSAQKAMLSMIISFAILKESSTKYNILAIDEVDGALDIDNRRQFPLLFPRLKAMVGCEQSFTISHNSELDLSTSDLILLKLNAGESYTNGNIIWQY